MANIRPYIESFLGYEFSVDLQTAENDKNKRENLNYN